MSDVQDSIPNDENEVFDIDSVGKEPKEKKVEPLYRVYSGSRIPVSKSMGKMWRMKKEAAEKAYELVFEAWNEALKYYNNNQIKSMETPRGIFKRGDSTENIVYSNLNVMLPATYSKDPDITCNTTDEGDADFVKSLQSLVNALFKRKDGLNAKSKFKRAVGFTLLTNFGVLKIDWTKKEQSSDYAMQQLNAIGQKLEQARSSQEVEVLYGQIEALEKQMEVFTKSGPRLGNILPHNLLIDPYAEDMDAMDSGWMMERMFYPSMALQAQYTKPSEDEDGEAGSRVWVYKPTHKATIGDGVGKRDDGLGMVLTELAADAKVTAFQDDERQAYIDDYYTEVFVIWDKATHRVLMYHRDDWTWPIWVWDDPLGLSRFFPYYVMSFGMSTGSTVTVGETSYYLDQQDEINDINRQVAKIRRSIFDFFYYNSDAVTKDEAEKFVKSIRGETTGNKTNILGVRAGENKISDLFQAFTPPQLNFKEMFNKDAIMESINRISNTSDALRGTQFKTNTNQDAVQSYQDAARMAVGAKIDVVEDCIADVAQSLCELCVQNADPEFVEGMIGKSLAQNWQNMSVAEFNSMYNIEVVAGTTEKPNSTFKKKEAVQIAQALGQFASAAPLSSMMIMLRVLEQAFTEVTIKPEDWDMLEKEATANMQKGVSTGGQQPNGAAAPGGDPNDQIKQQLMNLPPEVKQEAMQMKQAGKSDQEIEQFLMGKIQGGGGQGGAPQTPQQAAPQQPQAPQQ